jgi:hypothetical protein
MAEETGTQENVNADSKTDKNQEATITLTQAELDALMSERARRARESERKKYADYDELKAAAANTKAEQDANSELLAQALNELSELKAEKEAREAADAHAALVKEVAKDKGVDAEFVPLLTATTKEEREAQAELIATRFAEPSRNEGRKPAGVGKDKADLFYEWATQALSH